MGSPTVWSLGITKRRLVEAWNSRCSSFASFSIPCLHQVFFSFTNLIIIHINESQSSLDESNIVRAVGKARPVEYGRDSYVYQSGDIAIHHYFPHISSAQVYLYQGATQLAHDIAADFVTETENGVVKYEVNLIDKIIVLPYKGIYTLSKFRAVTRTNGYDRLKFSGDVFLGLEQFSEKVMAETGFHGIQMIPSNAAKYKKADGVLCVVTDICAKLSKLSG